MTSMLDLKAAAHWLGVSPRSLRRWVADERAPFIRLGHRLLFDAGDLVRWVDAHRHLPEDLLGDHESKVTS